MFSRRASPISEATRRPAMSAVIVCHPGDNILRRAVSFKLTFDLIKSISTTKPTSSGEIRLSHGVPCFMSHLTHTCKNFTYARARTLSVYANENWYMPSNYSVIMFCFVIICRNILYINNCKLWIISAYSGNDDVLHNSKIDWLLYRIF